MGPEMICTLMMDIKALGLEMTIMWYIIRALKWRLKSHVETYGDFRERDLVHRLAFTRRPQGSFWPGGGSSLNRIRGMIQ